MRLPRHRAEVGIRRLADRISEVEPVGWHSPNGMNGRFQLVVPIGLEG